MIKIAAEKIADLRDGTIGMATIAVYPTGFSKISWVGNNATVTDSLEVEIRGHDGSFTRCFIDQTRKEIQK